MRHLHRLGHSLTVGALMGAGLAPLQLILWPHATIKPFGAFLALFAWASWSAFWAGVLLFPLLELLALIFPPIGLQQSLKRRRAFWLSLFVALTLGGIATFNYQGTRELLINPNRQALAVAAWLALVAALVSTIIAWRIKPRRRSNAIYLGCLSVLIVSFWGVWLGTNPMEYDQLVGQAPEFQTSRPLLFVSWEGTDLAWLLPLMEHGDMPFLRSRFEEGAWGQLRSVRPFTRSAAFASLTTGCAPSVHGVVSKRTYHLPWLTESTVALLLTGPWPEPHHLPWRAWDRGAGSSPSRATLWQILEKASLRAGIVGWPPYLDQASLVYPMPLAAEVEPFSKLGPDIKTSLEPIIGDDSERSRRSRSSFAVAVSLSDKAGAFVVNERATATFFNSNLAARLRPLWTTNTPDSSSDEVLRQAAVLLDTQLETMWRQLGGKDVLLVVCSPYGLAPPSPWERLQRVFGSNDRWRVSPDDSPDGFVLFSGPGVKAQSRLRAGRIADVVPTLLYLLELPAARDMAGRVLLDAVSDAHAATTPLRLVPSYPASKDRRQR